MTSSSSALQVSLSSTLSTSPFASLDPLIPSTGTGLNLDSSLYALSHEITDEDREPTGQKITLLSRPHNNTSSQSPLSTSPLTNCIDDTMINQMGGTTSGVHLFNEDGGSSNQLLSLTRGDGYFDSEDPSVNLHEFIVNSLQAQKNRVILLQLEEEFLKYITDQSRTDSLKLPSWDSYHRMLAHRVAAYFGLDHNVDPLDKTCVVVQKGPSTRIPVQRFSDHIPSNLEEAEPGNNEPKLILKRIRETSGSEKFEALENLSTNSTTEIKSFEEREVEYEKARARIFSQSSNKLQDLSESTDKSFDLFNSNSSLRSALRAPMSHRRTFSDTAFFNTLKKTKQGPSSSGNSPSNTPSLFFPSLSPPPSLTPPPLSKSTSPTIGVGAIDSSPHHKTSAQEDSSIAQVIQQQQKKSPQSRSQSASYIPLYSQAPPTVPVMYHPQPTLVNPGPIYYNPMVVYPVAPPPTAAIHTYSHMVNTPVLQHYPNTIITHPLTVGSPKVGGVRMPVSSIGPEPLSPTGVLYRPLQQGSVQVKPDDYAVVAPPPSGHPAAAGPLWSSQIPVDHTQFTVGYQPQGVHSPQSYTSMIDASQLANQMEKNLTLTSNEFVPNETTLDKSRMSPVVQRHPGSGRGLTNPTYGGYSMEPVMVSPTTGAPPPHGGGFIPGSDGEQHLGYSTVPPQVRERQDIHHPLPYPGMAPPQGHHPQGMLPHSGNITPQPVQILGQLGHSLSTTIFSPPPSAGPGPPGMFYSQGGSSGKPPTTVVPHGSPAHAPVGSGVKFKKFNSPQQVPRSSDVPQSPQAAVVHQTLSMTDHQQQPQQYVQSGSGTSPAAASGGNTSDHSPDVLSPGQQLPPRLNQRVPGGGGGGATGSGGGTRYQNQRHPSNRNAVKGSGEVYNGVQGYPTTGVRREPLLPTPTEMIKLDTGITAGVPVNVMEVLYPPHEDSPEYQVLIQSLQECGAQNFKRGITGRNVEVMVAIFDSPDAALQGLKQCVLPVPAKLTIPLPNHAKYILQLLST